MILFYKVQTEQLQYPRAGTYEHDGIHPGELKHTHKTLVSNYLWVAALPASAFQCYFNMKSKLLRTSMEETTNGT